MRKHIILSLLLMTILVSNVSTNNKCVAQDSDESNAFSSEAISVTAQSTEKSDTTVKETPKETENKDENVKTDGYPVDGTIAGCSALRLRDWPWGPVSGTFSSGTAVTITGESGEFYQVTINGQTGYMHKNYINTAKVPASGIAPYYPGDTASGGYLPKEEGISQSNSAANNSSNQNSNDGKQTVVSGNEPSPKNNGASASGQAITSNSPDFNKWVDNAVNQYSSSWNFPSVTNKYGRTITPRDFILGIMWIESGGVHRNSSGKLTTSCCGAQGFMQLMPSTSKGLGIADPTDPAQNLIGSAKCFQEIFNCKNIKGKTGEEKIIMGACGYNMGPYSSKLAGTWEQFKASGTSVQSYGIKLKMCLGLTLTSDERSYVQSKMGQNPDTYADQCYAYTKGLGAFK